MTVCPADWGARTGALKSPDDFAADDYRRSSPRFQGENFTKNLLLVEKVQQLAADQGVTAVAGGWYTDAGMKLLNG